MPSGEKKKTIIQLEPQGLSSWFIRLAEKGETRPLRLLTLNLKPDTFDWTDEALSLAAKNNHKETVEFLVDELGADPAARDGEAQRFAAETGHVEIANFLKTAKERRTDRTWGPRCLLPVQTPQF